MSEAGGETAVHAAPSDRARIFRALRVLITLAAFAYILTRVPIADVLDAWKQLSPMALLAAMGFVFLSLVLGAVRWQLLLRAYGAPRLPSLARLLHLYLVGQFYNTYVPGGVGGDVVRGVASREAFGDDAVEGATGGIAIVFIERVTGVAALLTISTTAYLLWPIDGVDDVGTWAVLGLSAAVLAIVGLAVAPAFADAAPASLGRLLRSIPKLRRLDYFALVFVLSILVQATTVFAGHVIIDSLAPHVTLQQSAVAMPLIGASAFFPLTVGGAGVREFAFAALYTQVGVAEAVAYAGSLSFWAATLIVAAVGGVINFIVPIGRTSSPPNV